MCYVWIKSVPRFKRVCYGLREWIDSCYDRWWGTVALFGQKYLTSGAPQLRSYRTIVSLEHLNHCVLHTIYIFVVYLGHRVLLQVFINVSLWVRY